MWNDTSYDNNNAVKLSPWINCGVRFWVFFYWSVLALKPLKPRQHGALQILYCIVLYCIKNKHKNVVLMVQCCWLCMLHISYILPGAIAYQVVLSKFQFRIVHSTAFFQQKLFLLLSSQACFVHRWFGTTDSDSSDSFHLLSDSFHLGVLILKVVPTQWLIIGSFYILTEYQSDAILMSV